MKQNYIVIDVSLCHDCNNCFMACKDEHVGNSWLPYTDEQPRHGHKWVDVLYEERGQYPRIDVCYLAMLCQHCENAACVNEHPDCITRRDDGIVLIDPVKAKGKKEIVDSCPYGAIFWNEEADVAQKCTMCAHILDGDEDVKVPRCVHSCPTDAMQFYQLTSDELEKMIATEGLEAFHPEFGAKPHVYYKNLYRFNKNFITAGVVIGKDCAEGISVTLTGPGVFETQLTDYFGEFKFDDLDPGAYVLDFDGKATKTVKLTSSVNLGEIKIG